MFILICKMKPRHPETEPSYRCGFETYETQEEADEAAWKIVRENLPFRAKVIEVQNPWAE